MKFKSMFAVTVVPLFFALGVYLEEAGGWVIGHSDRSVFYSVRGENPVSSLGFIKRAGNCERDELRLVLAASQKVSQSVVGEDVFLEVNLEDREPYLVEATVEEVRLLEGEGATVTFSGWTFHLELFDTLEIGKELVISWKDGGDGKQEGTSVVAGRFETYGFDGVRDASKHLCSIFV